MINQWENISQLKCEYDLPLLCKESGRSILDELKIDPVNIKWNDKYKARGKFKFKRKYVIIGKKDVQCHNAFCTSNFISHNGIYYFMDKR